jgi:hypothetical protein
MTKQIIDWSAFRKFVLEFKDESDRAAVILGAAKLDALLYQILDRYMLPSLSSTDELLDGDAPLSTFSSRINTCYRLGLLSPEFAKALHMIRKIRNAFAHEISGCTLDTGPQGDRVRSLLLPLRPLHFFQEFRERFFGKTVTVSIEFKACLALMAARLEARLTDTETVSGHAPWKFIKRSWADSEITKEDEPTDPT